MGSGTYGPCDTNGTACSVVALTGFCVHGFSFVSTKVDGGAASIGLPLTLLPTNLSMSLSLDEQCALMVTHTKSFKTMFASKTAANVASRLVIHACSLHTDIRTYIDIHRYLP